MNLSELKQLITQPENEHLEFKEAKSLFSVLGGDKKNRKSVLGYCVALGNEGGGKLILGVSDKKPRKVIGTLALSNFGDVKSKIYQKLNLKIEMQEIFDEKNKARIKS